MEALHFCQSTNIFAALSGFIDLATRNLINVGFSYPLQRKQHNKQTKTISYFLYGLEWLKRTPTSCFGLYITSVEEESFSTDVLNWVKASS